MNWNWNGDREDMPTHPSVPVPVCPCLQSLQPCSAPRLPAACCHAMLSVWRRDEERMCVQRQQGMFKERRTETCLFSLCAVPASFSTAMREDIKAKQKQRQCFPLFHCLSVCLFLPLFPPVCRFHCLFVFLFGDGMEIEREIES